MIKTVYRVATATLFLAATLVTTVKAQTAITPSTALKSYLNNGDQTYRWDLKDTQIIDDVTVYHVLLTSQKWREHIWTHQLSILVPKQRKHDGALLFVTGGSVNKEGRPNWSNKEDESIKGFSRMATQNSAIVAVLKQTPNQPLYNGLTEDALISFT
ncbi:MAG: PhoPQ-activated pathogenicity-like protein PqaA type, partial [Pedobacter sp.]